MRTTGLLLASCFGCAAAAQSVPGVPGAASPADSAQAEAVVLRPALAFGQATLFLRTAPAAGPDTTNSDLSVEVTGFFNRRVSTTRGDSTSVVVDYRVRNTGNTIVRNYEAYFRIVTPRGDFFQEVQRTALAAGQTDIGRFEKDAGGALATSVRVDGFFINGQTRPASRSAGRSAGRQPIQPSR